MPTKSLPFVPKPPETARLVESRYPIATPFYVISIFDKEGKNSKELGTGCKERKEKYGQLLSSLFTIDHSPLTVLTSQRLLP
jgi:hypothetical protein